MGPDFFPIVYREFYDVPRVFIVFAGDERILLDCQFDQSRDDYPTEYQVYRMARGFSPPSGSWANVIGEAVEHLGAMPVAAVHFDATGRRSVLANAFREMLERTK